MTGLDAKFLYSETATAHMHTIKVAVSNVSAVEGGFSYDTLTEVLKQLLVRLPPFRKRIVPVPGGLGHPVWVEDPEFDLQRHISRQVLDHPGNDHQLAAAVGAFREYASGSGQAPLGTSGPRGSVGDSDRGGGEDPPRSGGRVRRGRTPPKRGSRRHRRTVDRAYR